MGSECPSHLHRLCQGPAAKLVLRVGFRATLQGKVGSLRGGWFGRDASLEKLLGVSGFPSCRVKDTSSLLDPLKHLSWVSWADHCQTYAWKSLQVRDCEGR